jgi:hypothetical protein
MSRRTRYTAVNTILLFPKNHKSNKLIRYKTNLVTAIVLYSKNNKALIVIKFSNR